MFNNAIEQVLAAKEKAITNIVKLGTVTSISGGRARVQHYGESAASGKDYVYIEGYYPEVGDKVALIPQGNTWIILGKILDTTPEEFAKKNYVDDTFLVKAYANKLQEGDDNTGTKLTLTGVELLPKSNNNYKLGNSTTQFLAIYGKELYADGTKVRMDAILVESGNNTYSLVLSYSSNVATLTPSADGVFALGTSSKKFKEAYLGIFRGTWKSGMPTERALAWNASNALVPDANGSVDLGSSSYKFANAYVSRLIGGLANGNTTGMIYWISNTVFAPSVNNSIELGKSGNQFNALYTKKLYLDGTEFDPSGITLNQLKATSSGYTRTLTLNALSTGGTFLPATNGNYDIGSSTYAFRSVYAATFTGDLDGKILNGSQYNLSWDSSHNLIPSTTNYLSLGTSQKQYKNVYGQNLYVNGTAVSSDRRIKKDLKQLDERYEKFFALLNPLGFKYIDGESDRTHTGFIAQEVEEAAKEAGLDENDLAIVVIDQDGRYYLRYEELVAVQAQVIQKMQRKVDSLETRIARLEALLERSMEK